MPLSNVWRINLKTAAEKGVDPRKFCLSQGCLGVGWPISDAISIEWEEYEKAAKEEYPNDGGWWPALNAIRNRMMTDDLCWTRDTDGIYYLGRITSPWQYIGNDENRKADVVNIRRCDWVKIGTVDAVPGKVVNSFGPSRTVQMIDDETVRIFSAYIYNKNTKSGYSYELEKVSPDIFSLLSSDDCEDLVSLYMQFDGYLLIASTCKRSTSAYEFVMHHRETGKIAIAQVKNGYDNLFIQKYISICDHTYLFTTKGSYIGEPSSSVSCISIEDMLKFIGTNQRILPNRIKIWIEIASTLAASPVLG